MLQRDVTLLVRRVWFALRIYSHVLRFYLGYVRVCFHAVGLEFGGRAIPVVL